MASPSSPPTFDAWQSLQQELELDVEHTRREIGEVELMIEQSQLEVDKLVQRNSSISVHLQQIQAQFDTMPRPDIRATYDAALEAQQRLFVMRGQLEKLQSDHTHLKKSLAVQEKVLALMKGGLPQAGSSIPRSMASTAEKLEMVIQAQEAERQKLSQQMHDGPAQALSNFILQSEIAMRLFDVNPDRAREELNSMKDAASATFQKVRDFIVELRPMMLDDLGLVPTLRRYVEGYKEQHKADIRLNVMGNEQRFEPYLEVMLFRSVQELLNNATRHSQATQIKVLVDIKDTDIRVSVEDNGRGFTPDFSEGHPGMGLKLIRERVEMLGGDFELNSAPGKGAYVAFQVPVSRLFGS
jgi:two-component system, NarL family, sensor histidine kinase DegS